MRFADDGHTFQSTYSRGGSRIEEEEEDTGTRWARVELGGD